MYPTTIVEVSSSVLEQERTDSRIVQNSRPPPVQECSEEEGYFDGFPPELLVLREQVMRIAPQQTTILLTGETGTGKTRLARLIHKISPRRNEPFLIVDCGALSPSLIESEMFGHTKGAFTGADRERIGKFAAAGCGTIILDEINSLPLALQSKLLRVVEDRVFEPVGSNRSQPLQARIIAISNALLDEETKCGRFRSDLYFRLNVVGIHLPTLRSRSSTVLPLCQKFLNEFAEPNRPDVRGINVMALCALQEYHWPGNIRELRNVVERAVALCAGPIVEVTDLPETIRLATASHSETYQAKPHFELPSSLQSLTLAESKALTEIQRIKEVLAKHQNNRLRAAAELGISRMGLYKKLHKYDLIQRTALAAVAIAAV
jgi:two-component system, NtrC family, response regulator AtoC